MSGGRWDYVQYRLEDIARDISEIIKTNDSTELTEWGTQYGRGYDVDTLDALSEAIPIIRMAAVHIQRADWLLSGDDGEDSYLRRLRQDINETIYNDDDGEEHE